jgi:hypothetical protein
MNRITNLFLTLFIIVFVSCQTKKDNTSNKKFNKESEKGQIENSDSESDQDNVVSSTITGEEENPDIQYQQNIEQLQRDLDAGKIDEETFHKQMEIERVNFERNMARMQNQIKVYSIPDWAKPYGLKEPTGLELDTILSFQQTKEENGVNSFELFYLGEYEKCLEQAKQIMQGTNLQLNSGIAEMIESAKAANGPMPKERQYTNIEINEDRAFDVFITVEEVGLLSIKMTQK